MTNENVPSITDEQLADLEMHADLPHPDEMDCDVTFGELRGLIARLRAAEKDAGRYRWLRDVSAKGSLGWLEFKSERKDWDRQIDDAMETQP